MKRTIATRILLLVLLSTGSVLTGHSHSKKTFLMPRAVGVNAAMEHTTWQSQVYAPHAKRKINSYLQLTPFYQHSANSDDTGAYFGVNGSDTIRFGNTAQVTAGTHDVDGGLFINDDTTSPWPQESEHRELDNSNLQGTVVTFSPKQEIFGARLDYFQSINSPIKGLFFKASMPFVHVENDVDMDVTFPTDGTKGVVTLNNKEYTVKDFFAGRVETDFTGDAQSVLANAKIDGSRSASGIADIDLSLGYKLLFKKTKYAFFNIGITIPTGNQAHGEYVFEPLYGNGDHFGLGGGVNAGIELWSCSKGWVRVDGAINYKYLFESTEKRTLGVKDKLFGQYYLGGVKDQEANLPLFPLANVLTRDVRVKPGSQIDSLIDFSFNTKRFVIDLGYNLYWKDEESVSVKNWTDGVYAIAKPGADTGSAFEADMQLADIVLDVAAAETPTQFTHKIFAGLAYKMDISKRYPTFVGLGGSYEFAHENSALEQYALWVKAGISF